MPFRLVLLPLVCLLLARMPAQAQPIAYLISQGGTVNTCSGALLDSGGEGGAGYGNNEHFVITICPGQPDSAISLSFVLFNLSAAGSIPTDHLSIYDGPDTSSPLIGTWSGNNSPNIVSASFANTSGCLTVEFSSNEMGTGVFAASISCTHPCEPPTAAAVMSEPSPALICQGEQLSFDGSASTAAGTFSIVQYLWDFGDGSLDSTSGPVVSHVFPNPPAQHVVHLMVKDDNDCWNTNQVDLVVQISTTPNFDNFDNITHCAGEPVDLTAITSVTANTWSSIPEVNFGGPIALPDDIGTPFNSTVTFTAFQPGQQMTSVGDILSVCVEMEHSFMGDFTLKLTSPTGQSMMLHEQGDGGTYLGEANDTDNGSNIIPGVCWEYCFSPTATLGTWADCAAGGPTPNVTMAGTPPSSALLPGTYTPVQPFNNLVGSQLNGTWTLTFTDLWGIDNGSICGWSINFSPNVLPDDVSYTPIPGVMHTDSSYWTGPDLSIDPDNPLHYIANPTEVGPHVYTYTVTDNFGCTYDTTLTITITPGVTVDPSIICGPPLILEPGLQLPLPSGTIVYNWSPAQGLSNTSTPHPTASPAVPTWYTLHAYPAGHPLCGVPDSVLVNPPSANTNQAVVTDHRCAGAIGGSIVVESTGYNGPWDYTWTDSSGTVVQTTAGSNGDTYSGPGGTYQIVVHDGPNGNGCTDTLTATIHEPPPLLLTWAGTDTVICLTGTALLAADATGGTGAHAMHWDHGAGTGSPVAVSPSDTTVYQVWATDANNCLSDTAQVTVAVRPPLRFHLADTVSSCPKVDLLLAADSIAGGDGSYSFQWDSGGSMDSTLMVNLFGSRDFCMTLRDGCETPALTQCVHVDITPVPPLVLTVDSVLGCEPFSVNLALEDTSGEARADWYFHPDAILMNRPMSLGFTYVESGIYDLYVDVHWPNGCDYDSTYAGLITVIDVPKADFTWEPRPSTIFRNEVHFQELAGHTATSFAWDFAGLGESTLPNPDFTFPDDTGRYYPVQLVVRNFLGCADSTVRMVNVDDVFLVHIPTAFSPDGNGRNDVLEVIGNNIADGDFHWMIFDRWGELVFETKDRHQGWDGKLNGRTVKNGVYVWMLHAQSRFTQVNYDLRGHVTVVR